MSVCITTYINVMHESVFLIIRNGCIMRNIHVLRENVFLLHEAMYNDNKYFSLYKKLYNDNKYFCYT